jgi:uncharacterized membrane protein YphA (DoxX/SURF4 family)
MHMLHVMLRLLLAAVFVVAGASKVASGQAWRAQAAGLGVASAVARPVPWFELMVGAVVAVGLIEPWSIVIALVTLIVFTGALVRTLRTGRRPPCACFGAWSAAPLGWGHVARNGAFIALAAAALATA